MVTEALEGIVGNTSIDIYPAGTTALYWRFSREEEEMFMMEEERRMESKMEIESAITAQYSDAPQPSQWILDQPRYGVKNINTSVSFDSNIREAPIQSCGTGYSFTTHVEPEPVMPLDIGALYQDPEPVVPTNHYLQIDGIDYSRMMNNVPEPEPVPQFPGIGCSWEFEIENDPGMKPIELLEGIGPMSKLNTDFNPLHSFLEDTHYTPIERSYIPTTNPTWDMDLTPKLEPVDYMSSATNIMNMIGTPELDLKPKSYLPSSFEHLPGMDFSDEAEPDTRFKSTSLILAEMQYKAKKSMDSLFSSIRETNYNLTTELDSELSLHLASLKCLPGIDSVPKPTLDASTRMLLADIESKKKMYSYMGQVDTKPKSYLPSLLKHQLDINSLPEPEPETPSWFIQYKDPTQTMLDFREKTRYGSTLDLGSEPKSYLSSLKNQLGMHLIPEPEPDDMPSVMDIMKVTVPKFDFSEYLNSVPEPEPVIPFRPVLPFMEHNDALSSGQQLIDSLKSATMEPILPILPSVERTSYDFTGEFDFPKQDSYLRPFTSLPDVNSVIEPEPYTPFRPVLSFMDDALSSTQLMDSLKTRDNPFPSFGNYAHSLQALEPEIPELKDYDITARYDLSGHKSRKKGPHMGYDFRSMADDGSEKLFKLPFFSEGGKKKDSIGLSEFGIGKNIIDEWRRSLEDE